MWIWSQGLGTLYRATSDGKATVEGHGYAGYGEGKNNPTFECMQDLGPLPKGNYQIGAPKDGPTPYALPLIPAPDTDLCNPPRNNFLIHGDRNSEPPRLPDVASHGCIILPREVRENIWQSGERDLLVVPYSPSN
jgi:hypothetical protein